MDAVERLPEEVPDIILLDMMMPGMDGVATLERLRRDPACAAVPVVFMTARVQPDEVAAYLALGAEGVIAKPYDPMSLAGQVNELWERHGKES